MWFHEKFSNQKLCLSMWQFWQQLIVVDITHKEFVNSWNLERLRDNFDKLFRFYFTAELKSVNKVKKKIKNQGLRIQVAAITVLFTCRINKKNITFVKTNFNLLVLLSNCWESAQKKSTRNLREGVTATIKDQPILFIDTVRAQTISSITIIFRASLLVVLSNWDNQKYS